MNSNIYNYYILILSFLISITISTLRFFQPIKKQGDLFQNFKPEFLKKDIIDEEFLRVMKPGNINNLSSDILYNIASYLETIDICKHIYLKIILF